MFYTADGNFQQSQKLKPADPNDEPLTLGAAFYCHEHDFATYQANRGKEKKEVCIDRATRRAAETHEYHRPLPATSLVQWGTDGTADEYLAWSDCLAQDTCSRSQIALLIST